MLLADKIKQNTFLAPFISHMDRERRLSRLYTDGTPPLRKSAVQDHVPTSQYCKLKNWRAALQVAQHERRNPRSMRRQWNGRWTPAWCVDDQSLHGVSLSAFSSSWVVVLLSSLDYPTYQVSYGLAVDPSLFSFLTLLDGVIPRSFVSYSYENHIWTPMGD